MKPGWMIAGSGILLVGGWVAAPHVGRRLGYFDVKHVEVVGARHVPPRAILESLKLPSSASVFDPLAPIASRVRKVPGIEQVEMSRRLPGTLVIKVTEAIPVALATTRNGLRMVDETGEALPFDPSRSAPDLPLTPKPDPVVARLLGRMREIDPEFYEQVESAWQVKGDVVLRIKSHRVWLRGDAGADAIQAIRLVTRDLERRGRSWTELDGRFADQVVVRWGSA